MENLQHVRQGVILGFFSLCILKGSNVHVQAKCPCVCVPSSVLGVKSIGLKMGSKIV